MCILKVSQSFAYFGKQGWTIHVRSLARHLVRRGHELTVLTANYDRSQPEDAQTIDGVKLIYLRSLARYRTATLNPSAVRFCRRHLRDFQVVHVYGLYDLLGPVVAFFCRRFRIPYVVEPMGMYEPKVSGLLKKRLYHFLLGGALVRGAARIVATSEYERAELVQAGVDPDKIVLRPNGVELEADERTTSNLFRTQWSVPQDAPLVLFLGRLTPVKGLELLLPAFADLPMRSARLVLAGPDEGYGYRQRLERMAADLGLSQRVIFTGPLYGNEKVAALRDADIFVLPSLSENFGIAAAEAVVCGTPVVVTERCGIAALVRDRAGLVVAHDVAALADGMLRLLTDASLYQRFKAQAPALARELSWEEPAAQMESMYRELLAENLRGEVTLPGVS